VRSPPVGRLAALGGAMLLLLGAVMLWFSSDNGRAVAVTSVAPRAEAPADPPEPGEELELFLEAPEPDLTVPEPPHLRAPVPRPKSAEEKRFDRLDRNRDGIIQQAEFLAQRRRNFDRLDVDRDGMLSFAEYAAAGIRRFAELDRDGSRGLDRADYAVSAPRPRTASARAAADCVCPDSQVAAVAAAP